MALGLVGLAVTVLPPPKLWRKILGAFLYAAAAVVFVWTFPPPWRWWGLITLALLIVAGFVGLQLRKRHKKRADMKALMAWKKPKPLIPRDPSRTYGGKPKYEVIGVGKDRSLRATLHDTGDGWIWGIRCEITRPSGKKEGRQWGTVTDPEQQQMMELEGFLVSAEEAGLYTVTWWVEPPAQQYAPEVIVSEQFPVPPEDRTITVPTISVPVQVDLPTVTQGPRPGWSATCEVVGAWATFGRGVILAVESPDEEASGIWCRVTSEHGTVGQHGGRIREGGRGKDTGA